MQWISAKQIAKPMDVDFFWFRFDHTRNARYGTRIPIPNDLTNQPSADDSPIVTCEMSHPRHVWVVYAAWFGPCCRLKPPTYADSDTVLRLVSDL